MLMMSGVLEIPPNTWTRASITGIIPDLGIMLLGGSGVFRIPFTLQNAILIGPALLSGIGLGVCGNFL